MRSLNASIKGRTYRYTDRHMWQFFISVYRMYLRTYLRNKTNKGSFLFHNYGTGTGTGTSTRVTLRYWPYSTNCVFIFHKSTQIYVSIEVRMRYEISVFLARACRIFTPVPWSKKFNFVGSHRRFFSTAHICFSTVNIPHFLMSARFIEN